MGEVGSLGQVAASTYLCLAGLLAHPHLVAGPPSLAPEAQRVSPKCLSLPLPRLHFVCLGHLAASGRQPEVKAGSAQAAACPSATLHLFPMGSATSSLPAFSPGSRAWQQPWSISSQRHQFVSPVQVLEISSP